MIARVFVLVLLVVAGCDPEREGARLRAEDRARQWEEPCHDRSVLLATTSGSPSDFECPNKHHRMRVQVATTQSNEEAAAVVLCQCVDDATSAADAGDGK